MLAFEKEAHQKGRTSLMLGKALPDLEMHVYKPKRIRKKLYYLPLYYRKKGFAEDEFEQKVSDRKLDEKSDWKPWIVALDHKVTIVARSNDGEDLDQPPKRLERHYANVWDKKVSEKAVPSPNALRTSPVRRDSSDSRDPRPRRGRPPANRSPMEPRDEDASPSEPPGGRPVPRDSRKRRVSFDQSSSLRRSKRRRTSS